MADIIGKVGASGAENQIQDVALIQAMLHVVKNPRGHSYLPGHYDGICGAGTIAAIKAFQIDRQTVKLPTPKLTVPLLPKPLLVGGGLALKVPHATLAPPSLLLDDPGAIKPDGATIGALNDALPASHKAIRTASGARLVYWPGSAARASSSAAEILAETRLNEDFRKKCADTVTRMYRKYGLVLSLAGNIGGPRTFQEQYVERRDHPTRTKAGPGESNHNFGQGMDLGFENITWMGFNGQKVHDDWWFNKLVAIRKRWANEMWDVRNEIAFDDVGLFPSDLDGDDIHVQRFSDGDVAVGMKNSLAKLLDTAGTFSWRHSGSHPYYECDLGYGGVFHNVGTSMEIWTQTGPMQKAWIAAGKGVAASSVTDADVRAMRQALRADFDAAEAARDQWSAVPK